jgi:ParB-like chromosome segregation protein Spo0J
MEAWKMNETVSISFQKFEFTLPISTIIPQRPIPPEFRRAAKYKMIAKSIKTLGLIEALVVYPQNPGEYLLLDGHCRLEALKDTGAREVRCTLADDDEAYTYNKRVNAISHVGQHFMILRALENGVSEERLSEALGLNVKGIRLRRDLLKGICPEVVHLLRNKKVPMGAFAVLRKMKPVRQIEAAEHMNAGYTFSVAFAEALLSVTPPELLVKPKRKPRISPGSPAAREMLQLETERLFKDLKMIEENYGKDVLTLTVWSAYVKKILANPKLEDYLSRNHSDLNQALKQAIAE